jgi:hypothetical protein
MQHFAGYRRRAPRRTPLSAHRVTLVLLVQLSSSSAASTFSYRPARDLAALSVTTTNAIVARASTPVAQTSALVEQVSRSVAIRSARRRAPRFDICASLSAYRGAAVLFKLLDVFVAAAQQVPRLVGGFCCAASLNAHGAERDGGTAIEWCAHCLASRSIARQYAVTIASRAAGQKAQYWAKAQNGEVVHNATPTVEPALDRASEAIVSASPPRGHE